jgi:predicted NUDIX family phosphoesterase
MNEGELVYAVPREVLLDGADAWLGVRRSDVAGILERTGMGSFIARAGAEVDVALKQIIPYLVLRDGDRIFLMKRTRAGGDARLHDHYTIGVGGHLNPGDTTILAGLRREWAEEIDAGFVPEFEFVGLLNDDTVEVGRHHLGIVFVADVAGRPVGIRETHKLSGSFETVAAARAVYDRMETWSQLTLDAVESSSVRPDPPDVEAAARAASRALPQVEFE